MLTMPATFDNIQVALEGIERRRHLAATDDNLETPCGPVSVLSLQGEQNTGFPFCLGRGSRRPKVPRMEGCQGKQKRPTRSHGPGANELQRMMQRFLSIPKRQSGRLAHGMGARYRVASFPATTYQAGLAVCDGAASGGIMRREWGQGSV